MTYPFATSGALGIDVTAVYAPGTSDYPYVTNNAQFKVGQQITASDNSVWVYVLYGTGGSTGAGYVVVIDSAFNAVMMSNSVGNAGDKIGVAPAAALATNYGWVQTYGTCQAIRCNGAVVTYTALASTTTAGALDDATTSGTKNISGIVITTTASGAGNEPGELNWPVVGTTN